MIQLPSFQQSSVEDPQRPGVGGTQHFNVPLGCNINTNLASNYMTIYSQNMLILHALQPLFTVGSSNAITFELGLKRYNLMCYKPCLKKTTLVTFKRTFTSHSLILNGLIRINMKELIIYLPIIKC